VDGVRTFANYDWSDAAFEGQQIFLGDYTWLTVFNNRAYGAWTEAAAPAAGRKRQGRRDDLVPWSG
jgi:hypothetical protein